MMILLCATLAPIWPNGAGAATTYTLTATASGKSWNTAANWSPATMPGTTSGVYDDIVTARSTFTPAARLKGLPLSYCCG